MSQVLKILSQQKDLTLSKFEKKKPSLFASLVLVFRLIVNKLSQFEVKYL